MDNPVSQSLLRKAPWLEAKGVRFDDAVVGYIPGVFGASDGIRASELVLLTQIARGIDVALRKEVMRFQKQNFIDKNGVGLPSSQMDNLRIIAIVKALSDSIGSPTAWLERTLVSLEPSSGERQLPVDARLDYVMSHCRSMTPDVLKAAWKVVTVSNIHIQLRKENKKESQQATSPKLDLI